MVLLKDINAEYKQNVAVLAENNSDLIFPNEGVEHAAIVLGNIFRTSKDVVRIYAKDMDGSIGDKEDYYKELQKYLDKQDNNSLRIIVDSGAKFNQPYNMLPTSLKILKDVKSKNANKVSVILSDPDFQNKVTHTINNNSKVSYFTLGDRTKFRIEYDNATHKANCSFFNPQTTEILIELFDSYFNAKKGKDILSN